MHDGSFGPKHSRALANCLEHLQEDWRPDVPTYSPPAVLVRNLTLFPAVIGHRFRRILLF